MKKSRVRPWLLPAVFVLPIVAAVAAVIALYGSDILDLLMIALKMVVIA